MRASTLLFPVPRSPLAQVLCEISDPSSAPFQELLDELKRICGVKNVLPTTCILSDSLPEYTHGGIFDGSKVRIKRVQTHSQGGPQKANEVCPR